MPSWICCMFVDEMMFGVSLGPSYHKVVKFKIFGDMKRLCKKSKHAWLLGEQTVVCSRIQLIRSHWKLLLRELGPINAGQYLRPQEQVILPHEIIWTLEVRSGFTGG